jgi:hypothetical protein
MLRRTSVVMLVLADPQTSAGEAPGCRDLGEASAGLCVQHFARRRIA